MLKEYYEIVNGSPHSIKVYFTVYSYIEYSYSYSYKYFYKTN